MIRRALIKVLKNDLKEVPAIVLLVSRQMGKATLVKKIAAESLAGFLYLDMESLAGRVRYRELFPFPGRRLPQISSPGFIAARTGRKLTSFYRTPMRCLPRLK